MKYSFEQLESRIAPSTMVDCEKIEAAIIRINMERQAATPNPGDKRVESAIKWVDNHIHYINDIYPEIKSASQPYEFKVRHELYMAYLAGYDEGVALDREELAEECRALQQRCFDLEFGVV